MASKKQGPFGAPAQVRVSITEADKRRLETHDWFVEYLNDDTRNAIAQALQLVDHEGDQIFYNGREVHGFMVTLDKVLFLHNSVASNTWKFAAYHREGRKPWVQWKGGRKSPPERLRNLSHVFMKRGENPLK